MFHVFQYGGGGSEFFQVPEPICGESSEFFQVQEAMLGGGLRIFPSSEAYTEGKNVYHYELTCGVLTARVW